MAFNTLDQHALLASLSPLSRNMWREAQKRKPFHVLADGKHIATFAKRIDAIRFVKDNSSMADHFRITQ